jgi:hypothetical protein
MINAMQLIESYRRLTKGHEYRSNEADCPGIDKHVQLDMGSIWIGGWGSWLVEPE